MNKRKNSRQRVSAAAILDSGAVRVDGVVLDVSVTGARLRLMPGAFIANQCVLSTTLFSEAMPSRVVWRRGAEVALRFKTMLKTRLKIGTSRACGAIPAQPSFGGGFGRRVVRA